MHPGSTAFAIGGVLRLPRPALATRRVSALSLFALVAGCAAPGPRAGDALPGVQVLANGNEVSLGWTADSLVNRALRPGTTVELVAEYPVAGGRVTGERLGATRVVAGNNTAQVSLPEALNKSPTGPICLRWRVGGAGLPIRAAGSEGTTDGFQYAAWGQQVAAASQRQALEKERDALLVSTQRASEAAASFTAWRLQTGMNAPAACDGLIAQKTAVRPGNVLEPSAHEHEARRECIYRFKKLTGDSAAPIAGRMEGLYAASLREARSAGSKSTAAEIQLASIKLDQAKQLLAAFQQFDKTTEAGFRPRFVDTPLRLTSSANAEHDKNGFTHAVAAALLDSFGSCVGDTVAQFKLSYETWQREQNPRLLASQNEALRMDCRKRFADDAMRIESSAKREVRLPQITAELAALPRQAAKPLPRGVALIGEACRLP